MSTNNILSYMEEMAIFVKVVESESFSEAARKLGVTPSAVSRAVSRLEKILGMRLLQRTTRKLRLSESGNEVYQRCVDMVNAAQSVMATSEQLHIEPQGNIRLSVPKAVGRFVIHPHMADFLAQYPKVVFAATIAATGVLPIEGTAIIFGVYRFLSMAIATCNTVGNSIATIVVAKWSGTLDIEQANKMLYPERYPNDQN